MAKYTSEDIQKIAERLRGARDRDWPAHFLIGAGCSISAGIPGAVDLVKRIHKDYPAHCAELSSSNRNSYGACMALLSLNERRDLIKPYLENAKINWGTIALAQLLAENFVSRVLTANFDLVLENACGLLGLQPAVYDFGVAPANDPAMIVSPAIIHMHGQSYGLVLLNTDEETRRHREKLRPILTDTLRNAPLIVVGYSGSADGIYQTILDEFEGRERLYWTSFGEEPSTHIAPFLEKNHFQFIGGADFDRFMIELAQSLGCWPPSLFSNPLGHLLDELEPVVSYPLMNSENAIDLLADLKRKLESWQSILALEDGQTGSLQEMFMKGDYAGVIARFSSRIDRSSVSDEDREIVAWSSIMLGNSLAEQAELAQGEESVALFAAADERYAAALAVRPDKPEALNNWGNSLLEQARRASGEKMATMFAAASEKYAAALAIRPHDHEALYNWANTLSEQACLSSGEKAFSLFAAADEKYASALAIKPDKHEAVYNWGNSLLAQARRAGAEGAAAFFAAADEKYAMSLAVKPDKDEALNNWGNSLLEQARRAGDEDATALFAAAGEKYAAALAVKSDKHKTMNNWGNLLSEQAKRASDKGAAALFAAAGGKYAAALAINTDDYEALNNWGTLLLEQAKRAAPEEAPKLFAAASEKYPAAVAIKPDKHQALNNWGTLLLEQAKLADGDEASALFSSAGEKYAAVAKIEPGETCNLACLAALCQDEIVCRRHLENAERHGTLPDRQHLVSDLDLASVQDRLWFLEMLGRQA